MGDSQVTEPNPSAALTPGARLGRFEILAFVGQGGLGQVYRARDTSLEREVAVKLLPADLFDDDALRRRFEREVRVLATLEHPRLPAMYGLEASEGRSFLVMEYVPGRLLSEILRERRLDLQEALALFLDAARALEGAHAHGIAHLDLNPANIVVTASGRANVVDFALAPVPRRGSDASCQSPEQRGGARGDERSDVWAFGCCLLRALTGRAEPTGTASDWESLPAEVPPPVSELLERCLSRAPEVRPTMGDALRVLEAAMTPSAPPVERRAPTSWIAAAVALFAASSLLAWWARSRRDELPRLGAPTQLTFAVGVEEFPSWSPEESRIAYDSNQSGNWDIWIASPSDGEPVNRTRVHEGVDRFPSWSPDGSRIAFWSSRDGGGIFVVPPLEGVPKRVAPGEPWGPPRWLEGGAALASLVTTAEGPKALVTPLAGGATREIELPGTRFARLDASWSPDESLVAYVDAVTYDDDVSRLRLLRIADGGVFDVTTGLTRAWSPSWSPDGRSLYFVTNRGGPMDLWRQFLSREGEPVGEPERVTTGVEVRNAAFSPDWGRLAYSKGRRVANVWRVPVLGDRAATWEDAEQLTFDNAYIEFIDVAPDGSELALSSNRSGNPDLWKLELPRGELQSVTTSPSPDWSPRWSPDGSQLAFYAYRTGNRDIWTMPASGGTARNLTEHEAEDFHPAWSPDGRRLAFSSVRSGSWDLWLVDIETAETTRLTTSPEGDRVPQWTPDGESIVFDSLRGGEWGIWRLPLSGGEPERLGEGTGQTPRLSPDGRRVYYLGTGDRSGNLWELSLEDGREQPLTDLRGRRGSLGTLALATDGTYAYFVWGEDLGDLWVMEVE